jgi:hypothetical protein
MFDMAKNKIGDKLLTRGGKIATLLDGHGWVDEEYYPYFVGNNNDRKITVTKLGLQHDGIETDDDIVGFADSQTKAEPLAENKGFKDDGGKPNMMLTQNAAERKQIPIVTGLVDYFPLALAEVAKCSKIANEQHNHGSDLRWDRTKSTDHIDCIGRHLIDRNSLDTDGVQHDVKLAWRALAYLQLRLEKEKV